MNLTKFSTWTKRAVLLPLSFALLSMPMYLKDPGRPPELSIRINLSEKEIQCLARNAYHEARGEPEVGVLGVIAVTVNRMLHPKFPANGCDVVYQKRSGICQFSWHCDDRIKPPQQSHIERFKRLVKEYSYGLHEDPTNGSIFFHSIHVKPYWSRKSKPEVVLANHAYFKELNK